MRYSGTLRCWAPPALLICLVLGLASWAEAQSTEGYDLQWSSVDGGGTSSKSSDGRFEVSGTVGQPDAGAHRSRDGRYGLLGGFWGGSQVPLVPALVQMAALSLILLLARLSWKRLNEGPTTS